MKLKLKNVNFKELFIQHVEKAVLALACVCLVLFLLSAVGRESLPLDKQPDQLVAQTNNAQHHVEASDPRDALLEIESADRIPYHTRVDREPVLLDTYATDVPFNAPILESKTMRDEPIYFSVRDLQVGTGFAPFATTEPGKVANMDRPGFHRPSKKSAEVEEPKQALVETGIGRGGVKVGRDDKLVVKYWAMVTGLIPIREQKAEYYKTFENAVNFEPDQDLPKYLGYQVERAEVTSGDMENLEWKPIKADTRFVSEWSGEYPELVAADYVTPMFAQQLGPRVGSDWENYVGHPEIPMEPKRGAMGRAGHGPIGADEPGGDFGMHAPAGGGVGSSEMGDEEEDEDAMAFDRASPRRKNTQPTEDPAELRRRQETVGNVGQKSIKGIDNLLFRFCDFTVRPGKQYVYRVRLGLSNPNRGLPVKYLRRPELADQKPRVTDWSEPSPIASIPYGDKMLAGRVMPAATLNSEPKGVLRIVQINDDLGAQVPLEKEVSRGTLANFRNADFRYKNFSEGIVDDGTGDFITNAMVLDMRGGELIFGRKEKEVTQPGELLVLNRTGELVALNEFDDEDAWTMYAPPEEQDSQPGAGFEGLPGGPMPDMETPGPPTGRKPPRIIRGGGPEVDILSQPPAPKRPKSKGRSK